MGKWARYIYPFNITVFKKNIFGRKKYEKNK
jgi:hypothetical protein